jgi:hypothetical protein
LCQCYYTSRQAKYLNNIVEQDHRAVKRITNPMLGFKSFRTAQKLIAGIGTMHMVKKGQLDCPNGQAMSAADQYAWLRRVLRELPAAKTVEDVEALLPWNLRLPEISPVPLP